MRGGRNGNSLRRMRGPWAALRHIHHLLKEALRERVPNGGASRFVPEIMQLVRIGGKVVELAPGRVAIDADAPAMIDQRAHRQLRRQRRHRPLRAVLDEDAVVACAITAIECRQQALALDAVVGCKPRAVEEAHRDVERAEERAGSAWYLVARLDPDEGR